MWSDKADVYGRHTRFLNIMPQYTYGARAARSDGQEQDGVDLILLE